MYQNQFKTVQCRWTIIALAAAIGLPVPCAAQSTRAPPRQDSSSPTGVSYRSGALSYSEQDLSIGGDLPNGLSLTRVYNSGVGGFNEPAASWSYNMRGYVSVAALPLQPDTGLDPPPPGAEPYIYNVTFGGKSIGFVGGSNYGGPYGQTTGGPGGTYTPALPSGASLVYNGGGASGYYTLTDSDGSVVNFTIGPNGNIANWTMPDGTRLEYSYTGERLRSIISNRGWAILIESASKACAVNMARTYVTATSNCPTDATTVTYTTAVGTFNGSEQVLTSATRNGNTTTYTYNARNRLTCVKEPGQSVCKLQTTYTQCPNDPNDTSGQATRRYSDYVTSQVDAAGKTYAFAYSLADNMCPLMKFDTNTDYRPFTSSTTTMTSVGATTVVTNDPSGLTGAIKDPLNRTTNIWMTGGSTLDGGVIADAVVTGMARPEGDAETYAYDERGNLTTKVSGAKPGTGLPNITVSAVFPVTCVNIKTCNKPTSETDARGATTDYAYDATHGGVLTETGPADPAGVRPVKRFAYVQRYAWIKNSGGTFSQAASPVWLLSTMKTCRTTATVSGACAGGSSDEVVTTYEYGPDTGAVGNNLLVRGMAVTADGTTLRTCYGYDRDGNRINQTSPRAGLSACS